MKLTQLSFFDRKDERDEKNETGVQHLAYCNICTRWKPRSEMRQIPQTEALVEYKAHHGEKAYLFKDRVPGHFMCPIPEDMAWSCVRHGGASHNGCTVWRQDPEEAENHHLTESDYGRWCRNCLYRRHLRDIIANPIGEQLACIKGLNGNPDNIRMMEQEDREGYSMRNARRDLFDHVLPPALGQPVELRDEEGAFRMHLFQIQGVEKVKVVGGPRKGERWSIAGWGYNQGFSSFIEEDGAEFLIELGVAVGNAHSVMGNSASVRKHVLPIRKQLGFVGDPMPHRVRDMNEHLEEVDDDGLGD